MKRQRIALFGLFGQQNLGNECTLQAMVQNLRQRLPDADVFTICTDPEEASKWHDLPALPFSAHYVRQKKGGSRSRRRNVFSLLRLGAVWISAELAGWVQAFKVLKGAELLAMTGTGLLTDNGVRPWGLPYELFKWALVGKCSRCKVCFVSVGVGPINQSLSRQFIRLALRLADYRCYRDDYSRTRIDRIGFNTAKDFVFPDLAFSLPGSLFAKAHQANGQHESIGVGIMDYDGPSGVKRDPEQTYNVYLDKICELVAWLLQQNYSVRILHGDVRYDANARKDLKRKLEQRGLSYGDGRIIDEDVLSVSDLVAQLASVKMVISPRFHNQLLALMLGKPVISISYDPKSDALLEGVGLGQYCQPIGDMDVAKLIEQFQQLKSKFAELQPALRRKMEEYRKVLDEQYGLILSDL